MRWLYALPLLSLAWSPLHAAPKNAPVQGTLTEAVQDANQNTGTLTIANLQGKSVQFQVTATTRFEKVVGDERAVVAFPTKYQGKLVAVHPQKDALDVAVKVEVFLEPAPVAGVLTSLEPNEEGDTAVLTLTNSQAEELTYQVNGDTLFEELKAGKRRSTTFAEAYKGEWGLVYAGGKGTAARVEILVGNRPARLTPKALAAAPVRGTVVGVKRDGDGDSGSVEVDDGDGSTRSFAVPTIAPYINSVGAQVAVYPTINASRVVNTVQVYPPSPVAGRVVNVIRNGNWNTLLIRNGWGRLQPFLVNYRPNFQTGGRPIVIYPPARPGPNQVASIQVHPHHQPGKPPYHFRPMGKPRPSSLNASGKPKPKPARPTRPTPVANSNLKPPAKPHPNAKPAHPSKPATGVKPHPKPPAKPGEKPHPKPAAKPATKPAAKPPAKPGEKPHPKPATKPAAKPAAKPHPKPAAKPTAKPAAKPKPVAKPAAKPKPVAKPAAKPKPATKPAAKPKPAPKPAAKPKPKN